MSAFISHSDLAAALGFTPQPGCTHLVSPKHTDAAVESLVSLSAGCLQIQTREAAEVVVDMLRLVLREQPEGWHIEEQIHSGVKVKPDGQLALNALAQNLCATPLPAPVSRKACRP